MRANTSPLSNGVWYSGSAAKTLENAGVGAAGEEALPTIKFWDVFLKKIDSDLTKGSGGELIAMESEATNGGENDQSIHINASVSSRISTRKGSRISPREALERNPCFQINTGRNA